jgi:membrane-bound lytic murein transglycosylase B
VGVATTGALLLGLVVWLSTVGGTGAQPVQVPRALLPAAPVERLAPAAVRADGGPGPTVDPGWAGRVAAAAGIPAPAVRAYGAATLRVARQDPGCHLGWTTLAGLGWVESQHGTMDGRQLEEDGRSDRPVFGPDLNGRNGTAAIRSTSGGWERAVGPLQFLPSTWDRWAADGDGDGAADPQDLDDAALAAGRYLCGTGSDLAAGSGWVTAILAYNHDAAYVSAVYDAAMAYAGDQQE